MRCDTLKFCQQIRPKQTLVVIICIVFISSVWWMSSLVNIPNVIQGFIQTTWRRSNKVEDIKPNYYFLITANYTDGNKQTFKRPPSSKDNKGTASKLILLKNSPGKPWDLIAAKELRSCSANCTLVTSGNNLNDFDAVIFYGVGYPRDSPPRKTPGQVWIYFIRETPYYSKDSKFNRAEWRNKINWTMTYRSDSDIWYPYGRILKREKPKQLDFQGVTKNKTKLAAWFVSHCRTPGERHKYVEEIQKTISVDIYGRCGNKKCDNNKAQQCLQMLSRDYKFYISFENSFCYDYITEKALLYMGADIVPVVRGGANYSKFLPPNSFINTADFKSPKLLAEYLLYLDKNHTAYVEYLQWKNHYYSETERVPICELCTKLSNATAYANVYKDIYSWWHKDTCKRPNDLGS
ncbi:alpha-(1,3)-fucosyltransferase C-like [Gigantopelta aegis]|uniref:alpha-(1,3)-fucosyltransferase C-like n=1 Tax=Gigantopelta aegis TaxID=1735272 RepID=UPI001B88DF4B|nr:alpha-(1,3)-fucosyltransferase C-like [Gigantopelta aegis]